MIDALKAFLDFANHATGKVLVCLCLIIIILLLLDKYKESFAKLFKKQDLATMKIEGGNATLNSIAKQLEKIAGNHLHELPEMNQNINKIIETLGQVQKTQGEQGQRISKIEGKIGL